jgi:hypothetical protein
MLSACVDSTYVESDQGVGFGDYQSYSAAQLAREADARRRATSTAPITQPVVPPPVATDRVDVSGIVSNPPPVVTATQPPPVATATATTTPPPVSGSGISDENDFNAVASRETIESDAARIAANAAAYEQVQPTALPDRPVDDAALIVEFALSTTNSVGQSVYKRSGVFAQSRFERNCAKYPSQDKAQEAFLKAGGPKRDGKGLDPDGDGFACYWDPAPFRSARMGAISTQPVVPVTQ